MSNRVRVRRPETWENPIFSINKGEQESKRPALIAHSVFEPSAIANFRSQRPLCGSFCAAVYLVLVPVTQSVRGDQSANRSFGIMRDLCDVF